MFVKTQLKRSIGYEAVMEAAPGDTPLVSQHKYDTFLLFCEDDEEYVNKTLFRAVLNILPPNRYTGCPIKGIILLV